MTGESLVLGRQGWTSRRAPARFEARNATTARTPTDPRVLQPAAASRRPSYLCAMSISALTTVGAVRDVRQPRKQDAGKAAVDAPPAPATLTDLLVTQVPTELVAPYTAVMAGIVGLVAKPTAQKPSPDQLTTWRWIAFGILLVGTFFLVWEGKRRKAGGGPFPLLEVTAALGAAVGWAFALPASPLLPYLHGRVADVATPLLIAFGAVVFTAVTASALQSERRSAQPAPPA